MILRALQIAAVFVTVGILYGVHSGAGAFADVMGPQFTFGFLAGAVVTILMGFILHWLDKRLPRSTNGR